MPDILCLDTEPETVASLRRAGHNVAEAPFGYRNGVRQLSVAPHDFDLIVCDLRNPACFEYGVVVLSNSFFSKNWPKAELDALFGMQMGDGRKRILPIWHGVTREAVAEYSPLLSTLYAANSTDGLAKNVEDILRAIGLA